MPTTFLKTRFEEKPRWLRMADRAVVPIAGAVVVWIALLTRSPGWKSRRSLSDLLQAVGVATPAPGSWSLLFVNLVGWGCLLVMLTLSAWLILRLLAWVVEAGSPAER